MSRQTAIRIAIALGLAVLALAGCGSSSRGASSQGHSAFWHQGFQYAMFNASDPTNGVAASGQPPAEWCWLFRPRERIHGEALGQWDNGCMAALRLLVGGA
jgi:hypothetical protein